MENFEKTYEMFPELKNSDTRYLKVLAEYIESVNHLADNELNLEFNNKDHYHAAIVMSTLFSKAKSSIKIFAGDFKGKICDNRIYINSLVNAIKLRSVDVSIVFENSPNKNSICYKEITNLVSDEGNKFKLSIGMLKEEFKSTLDRDFDNRLSHFTVVDKKMFRYETDTEAFKAFCNFDDSDISTILDNNFSVLEKESVPCI
jgi:hypothetical protein